MDIKELLKEKLSVVIEEIPKDEIEIEIPKDKSHGDYSTNVAMRLCKIRKASPMDIASLIVSKINRNDILKIEIKSPGFINFFMNKQYLINNINTVLMKDGAYGSSNKYLNKKINVEFVSVNPTGNIHIGHTRGACYGDSLANILKFVGFDVTKEYYINDAGNQMMNMAKSIKERYKELLGLPFKMEDNYYYGEEIIKVAKEMYEEKKDGYLDAPLEVFKERGLREFLSKIKKDLEQARINFDVWTSEQALRDRGLVEKTITKLQELGYTYEQDGAVWLKTSLFGDEKDRVIIKNDGSYTYFLPDIAYHLDKLERGYDKLIDVFGADHHGYVARLKAAVTMLGGDKEKLDVELVQMVRAIKNHEEYKLSKRTGKTITMKDLIDDAGTDAIRYFFVSKSLDTQMDFDVDLARTKSNDNPVYYIQYAHARICSILNSYDTKIENTHKIETIDQEAAYNVLAKIYEFPSVVERSAIKKTPHLITNYAYELAHLFHSYYSKEKIITEDKNRTQERIMFIKAVKITIANALRLIGVEAIEKM